MLALVKSYLITTFSLCCVELPSMSLYSFWWLYSLQNTRFRLYFWYIPLYLPRAPRQWDSPWGGIIVTNSECTIFEPMSIQNMYIIVNMWIKHDLTSLSVHPSCLSAAGEMTHILACIHFVLSCVCRCGTRLIVLSGNLEAMVYYYRSLPFWDEAWPMFLHHWRNIWALLLVNAETWPSCLKYKIK